jgi:hypothetical protein
MDEPKRRCSHTLANLLKRQGLQKQLQLLLRQASLGCQGGQLQRQAPRALQDVMHLQASPGGQTQHQAPQGLPPVPGPERSGPESLGPPGPPGTPQKSAALGPALPTTASSLELAADLR